MLKNHLLIAFRTLAKYKLNTSIHMLGLSIGLACCLLIYTFIQHHRQFDRHHAKADNTYRVNYIDHSGGEVDYDGNTPYPLAPALRNDFPDWEAVARTHTQPEVIVGLDNGERFEADVLFAEPELLDIFDFKAVDGDLRQSLAQPGTAVLAASAARRFFGEEEALGKTITLDGDLPLAVGAIMEDIPVTSHIKAEVLVSFESFPDFYPFDPESWGMNIAGSAYVVLPPNVDELAVNEQLDLFVDKYFTAEEAEVTEFVIQPLSDIHFNTRFSASGARDPIAPWYLWFFGIIGGMILIVACINFINLSTAQAFRRAKEVGVRKVIGANRRQLILQFLGEAFLITAVAALLAAGISHLAMPQLNTLMDLQMSLDWLGDPALTLFLLLSVLAVTLLAGAYPAFVLSYFRPVNAIKGKVGESLRGTLFLRRGLVTAQFGISFLLIIGTLIVSRQLNYFRQSELGFDKESIVEVRIPEPGVYDQLKEEWLKSPNVEEVSFALGAPTSPNNIHTRLYREPDNEQTAVDLSLKPADHSYLETYGLELLAGRDLAVADNRRASLELPEEQQRHVMLVNEQLMKELGYKKPQDILGQEYQIGINNIRPSIVGVVRDFHTQSLHHELEPMAILHLPFFYYNVGLKIRMDNAEAALNHIEAAWSREFPDGLFNYEFLDDTIAQMYEAETRLFRLFQVFAGLAVFIACLGLWGLATFITQQRTKEIGVRKVLGATVSDIILLLNGEFTKLVGFAFLLAAPLAYWGALRWLDNFQYRAELNIGLFLLAGLLVLLAAWLTVSYRSLRAATANPAEALKNE